MNGEGVDLHGLIWDFGGRGIKLLRDVTPADPITLVLFVVFAVGVVYVARQYGKRRRMKALRIKWGAKMSRPEQFKYERRVIADMLEDAILTAECEGYLSYDRAKQWRVWFATILDNPDLLSKGLLTLKKRLKDNNRKRLTRGEAVKPLPIPEPEEEKITTEENIIRVPAKTFTCKFLDRKVA